MSIKHVYWRRDTEEDCPNIAAFQQVLDGDFSALDEGYVPGVAMSTTNRAFYMTESGSVGLCNSKARCGDTIWVLVGAKVPFVLRKAIDAYHIQNAYQFIGDCFLFNGMDGEVLGRGTVEENVILVQLLVEVYRSILIGSDLGNGLEPLEEGFTGDRTLISYGHSCQAIDFQDKSLA
jgi:hypothetical protein